jgi:hypothetical protein
MIGSSRGFTVAAFTGAMAAHGQLAIHADAMRRVLQPLLVFALL